MGIRKKQKVQPKPEPVKVPSRGVLLNKWAARQDKLQKLVGAVAEIKKELVGIAADLHQHYGVLVQDTTHTVLLPKAAPVVSEAARPSVIDPAPATAEPLPEGTTPDAEGKPVKLLKPEDNPLAKSPIPIVGEPVTAPMTEDAVRKIREGSTLEQGSDSQQLAQAAADGMERAIRLGLGKR